MMSSLVRKKASVASVQRVKSVRSGGGVGSSGGDSSGSAVTWLLLWTANNVGVTILNKSAFAKVDFKYPYFLSALHMCINAIGCQLVFVSLKGSGAANARAKDESADFAAPRVNCCEGLLGSISRKELDRNGRSVILAFSLIFSLNIAIGNVSLRHVSVNFNQVMRSLVPAITIAMGLAMRKPISKARQWAVMPVVVGVAMACYGDMSYTIVGFAYTCMCVLLAALKVVASGEMLTGRYKLHPVDLLGHMAPLAMLECLLLSLLTGECTEIANRWHKELSPFTSPSAQPFFIVMAGALSSFSLNICSLMANKMTSPLTLCIASNVKQVLMIALGTAIFGDTITFWNGLGIVVVLCGSAKYSYICVLEKGAGAAAGGQASPKKGASVDSGSTNGAAGKKVLLENGNGNGNGTTEDEEGVALIQRKTDKGSSAVVTTV